MVAKKKPELGVEVTFGPATELPDSIKIFHTIYALDEMDLSDFASDPKYGSITFSKKLIQYMASDDGNMVDTIIHEVLHGIIHHTGLTAELGDLEEKVVYQLAMGLATIMKDNPTLFPALQEICK